MLADDPLTSSTPTAGSRVQQAGAICYYRNGKRRLRILSIGSRRNGRGDIPKGHPDPGQTSQLAAGREALEATGVAGKVTSGVFGSFTYTMESLPYYVAVHLLEVAGLSAEFPAKTVRRQKWFPLNVPVRQASQPGLRALLAKLEAVAS
ncbi:NUDIX hydrolase (plasmid) [Sinorhizobium sp. B11]